MRGFGGRRKYNLYRIDTGESAGFTYGRFGFDYTAIVRTTSWAAIGSVTEPNIVGEIRDIRNETGVTLQTSSQVYAIPVSDGWKIEQISALTKTPVGIVTRYVKSAEAMVVSDEERR